MVNDVGIWSPPSGHIRALRDNYETGERREEHNVRDWLQAEQAPSAGRGSCLCEQLSAHLI